MEVSEKVRKEVGKEVRKEVSKSECVKGTTTVITRRGGGTAHTLCLGRQNDGIDSVVSPNWERKRGRQPGGVNDVNFGDELRVGW